MKLVREDINFQRGQEPMVSMGLGEASLVKNFLEIIAGDYQFDKSSPNYMGFINLFEDGLSDDKMIKGFVLFVENWQKYLPMARSMGLYLSEVPDLDETIFYDDTIPDSALTESENNFERGINPKEAMGIGGIDPINDFKNGLKNLYQDTVKTFEDLVGRTITANMRKYWMDEDHRPIETEGRYTIKVTEIYNHTIEVIQLNRPQLKVYFEAEEIDEKDFDYSIVEGTSPRFIYSGDGKIVIH